MKTFYNPVKVCFGEGAFNQVPKELGKRTALLVTTPGMQKRGVVDRLQSVLGDNLKASWCNVKPNPTVKDVQEACHSLDKVSADVVIGLGGGSALDTAKAISIQKSNQVPQGFLSQHLREKKPIPDNFVASKLFLIPTTAGTGSEVTMWGTVWDEVNGNKYSISHSQLYPECAFLDPSLTVTLPLEETVYSALDALSHSMEAIWNHHANDVSDVYSVKAISMIVETLPSLITDLNNLDLRSKVQQASLFAGLSFSQTRTALSHSISYPLTSSLGVPHGLACSFTLPQVLSGVVQANPQRASLIARALGCESNDQAVDFLKGFFKSIELGSYVKRYIDDTDQIQKVTANFINPSRSENNLFSCTEKQAREISTQAYLDLF